MLARANRIVEGDELRLVSRRGQRFRSPLFSVACLRTSPNASARFGFIASKQVGGAVTRNLAKRRLRALAAKTLVAHAVGYDLVVRAHPDIARASFAELSTEWQRMESTVVAV